MSAPFERLSTPKHLRVLYQYQYRMVSSIIRKRLLLRLWPTEGQRHHLRRRRNHPARLSPGAKSKDPLGLLNRIGPSGIIVFSDFSTILAIIAPFPGTDGSTLWVGNEWRTRKLPGGPACHRNSYRYLPISPLSGSASPPSGLGHSTV